MLGASRLRRSIFPGNIAYVWHDALHATTVADSLVEHGFTVRAQIIWAKERLVMSRGDYHWQHEPCWYAVRTKGHWTGDRKQTTLWSIASGGQDSETSHSTQKPVECMRRPMQNNSNPGQAVYDPFLGSGTTLIAAETTGRVDSLKVLDPNRPIREVDIRPGSRASMTLANMRAKGVQTLAAWWLGCGCNNHRVLDVSTYPDEKRP